MRVETLIRIKSKPTGLHSNKQKILLRLFFYDVMHLCSTLPSFLNHDAIKEQRRLSFNLIVGVNLF